MDTVAIYREQLLPPSETFIAAQAATLRRHRPVFVGIRRDARGVKLLGDAEKVVLEDHTRRPGLWREAQRIAGFAHPAWRERIATTDPASMHAHFGVDAVWAMPVAEQLGVPLLATFHGWDYAICRGSMLTQGGPHYPLYARRRHALFERVARCIAVSEYCAEQLRRLGCPDEKIVVHHIGVDTASFTPGSSEQREPIVLFVGRLIEQKGCASLIRSMARLRSRFPDVELLVVGDGPQRAELTAMAQELGVRHRFTGALPPERVGDLLRRSSVFCVPSRSRACGCGESFGLAFAEAQASGLPVVAFRQGGVIEAVEDGVSGRLVAEGDEGALTNALEDLLRDPTTRDAMGRAGRKRVEARFDLRTQTERLEDIYDEVAGVRRASVRGG